MGYGGRFGVQALHNLFFLAYYIHIAINILLSMGIFDGTVGYYG
jgi:hypothetical protein